MGAERQPGSFGTALFLARQPVFTLGELRRHLRGAASRQAALERVKYHAKRGRLKPVSRGVYATVPIGVDASGFVPDRFLVAAAVRPDAVLSHHSALELLGAAHSDWNRCTAFTGKRHAPVVVSAVTILFLQDPPALRKGDSRLRGVRRIVREGITLHLTGPERTLLDGFRQPRLAGGLAELVESASGFGVLDLDLLWDLLGAYDQKILYAAAGWFLEMNRQHFSVRQEFLHRLEERRPRSRHYLPRGKRRGGVLVPRWNFVLPEAVVRGKEPDEA